MGEPDHLTCLLRNLLFASKATVRTRHGTTGWFQIGKGVCKGSMVSPWLFSLYVEYIMQNARLDESQAGIKVSRRNVIKLRYTDDITLMAESEEELKRLLMRLKDESEKAGLKIMASSPITSWQIDGEKMESDRFYFLRLQNHCRW